MDIINQKNTAIATHRLLIAFSAFILLCLANLQTAHAGTLNLILNGKAIHFQKSTTDGRTFNENNWGAGFQYDFDEVNDKWVPFVTASGFSDSFKHASYNAGGGVLRRYKFGNGWHFDAGVYAFAMTRKDVNNNSPFLGVLPVASIGTDMISVNMTYIPKVRPKFVELVFFQLKINTEIFN